MDIVFLRKTNIHIVGQGNTVMIESYSRLKNCNIFIYGYNNSILLGRNLNLSNVEFHIEDNNTIRIGDFTTIEGKTHLDCIEGSTISIGIDCMFSSDIVFRTGDSHSIINEYGKRINKSKDITIGNHVWFGQKTIILKGTIICDDCIVATGAIVTKSFENSNIIIAGSPANKVKENINWLRERIS